MTKSMWTTLCPHQNELRAAGERNKKVDQESLSGEKRVRWTNEGAERRENKEINGVREEGEKDY